MKTLRYISCPVCDYSMSAEALSKRMVGRFRADIRLCRGRKGLPHVAFEDMSVSEMQLVRQRLLTAVRLALSEEVITNDDLRLLAPGDDVARGQIPIPIPATVGGSPAKP